MNPTEKEAAHAPRLRATEPARLTPEVQHEVFLTLARWAIKILVTHRDRREDKRS
jgi:hypothetical protein